MAAPNATNYTATSVSSTGHFNGIDAALIRLNPAVQAASLTGATALLSGRAYKVNSVGGAFALTLPNITSDEDKITIYDVGNALAVNNVTVNADASDDIEGNASFALSNNYGIYFFRADLAQNRWVVSAEGSAGAGIANVVEDTTPQAGGDFDFQNNDIFAARTVGFTDTGGNGQFWFFNEDGTNNLVARYGATEAAATERFRITPTGDLVTATFDSRQIVPVATTLAAVNAVGNAINTTDKALGKAVLITDLDGGTFARAAGAAAADVWLEGSVTVGVPV